MSVLIFCHDDDRQKLVSGWGCSSLAVDHADNWLVCGHLTADVTVFKRDGTLLTKFRHNDIHYPLSVCVDRDGRYYVSAQVHINTRWAGHAIVVLGFCG